ncbi:MAG: thiolase family protein [Leptospira sp.]|nr:thiolase family protein [Leptospira sp.]
MADKIFLHNPALSNFGKLKTTVLDLSFETANHTLKSFDRGRIEFLIFSSFCPEKFTNEIHLPSKLTDNLRLKSIFTFRTETASSSGASAFHLASYLLRSGKFKTGMVVATEVMGNLSREENNSIISSVLSDRQKQVCMSMAQGGAMITTRYLHEHGYNRDDLFLLSKKLHDNGCKNPVAQIRKNISREDYFSAPLFAAPLGLFDISPISDGSASLILSTDLKSDFILRGTGSGTDHFYTQSVSTSFPASLQAFQRAYSDSDLKPEDIRVAELHDAFTPFELIGAEDAGLFPKGKALEKVISGVTHPEGDLPINPSGGLKSRGHPIGASGLAQIVELMRFMDRNPEKNIGLAHSIGGLATNNFATIIEKK